MNPRPVFSSALLLGVACKRAHVASQFLHLLFGMAVLPENPRRAQIPAPAASNALQIQDGRVGENGGAGILATPDLPV